MTWWDVEPLAKAGVPVRRAIWTANKAVIFKAGLGTTRVVGLLRDGEAEVVLTNTAFTAAEFMADDWQAL